LDTRETKELIHGAIRDAKQLMRLEARLIKHETLAFCTQSKRAVGFGLLALAGIFPALTLLAMAAATGLQTVTLYPQWLCYALVGLALIALSALCLAIAQRTVEKSIKELFDGPGTSFNRTGNTTDYPVLARQD
jgi:hypothetical protein